jgi:hypothetical protein
MITVTKRVFFTRSASGRRRMADKLPAAQSVPTGRVPRISKVMALALHFEDLIRSGRLADKTEIARLARVTQPRITQVMNFLYLSPSIQEELLFLPRVFRGDDPIHEKLLRPVCAEINFVKQRRLWEDFKKTRLAATSG